MFPSPGEKAGLGAGLCCLAGQAGASLRAGHGGKAAFGHFFLTVEEVWLHSLQAGKGGGVEEEEMP